VMENGWGRTSTRSNSVRDENWEGDILCDLCRKPVVFLLVCRHSMSLLNFMSFHQKENFLKFSISEGGVQWLLFTSSFLFWFVLGIFSFWIGCWWMPRVLIISICFGSETFLIWMSKFEIWYKHTRFQRR